MQEIELKRKRYKFKLDGQLFELKTPNIAMLKEYDKNVKKAEKEESEKTGIDVAMEFLVSLGLPESVCDTLEPEHLEVIVTNITGQKKS